MIAFGLAQAAYGQQIELAVNRIAVLDPGFAPSAVRTTAGHVVDVVAVPPVLLLVGMAAGKSTVLVERADGAPAVWDVRVDATDRPPSGGPGLLGGREALSLPVHGAAVCTIPDSTTFTRVDRPEIVVAPFGASRWLVEVERAGFGDVVFDGGVLSGGRPPRPPVLAVSSTTGAAAIGASCVGPTETVRLVVGESVELHLADEVSGMRIGAPSVAHGLVEASQITLTAVGPGTTVLAARTGDKDPPFLRTVVVTAP